MGLAAFEPILPFELLPYIIWPRGGDIPLVLCTPDVPVLLNSKGYDLSHVVRDRYASWSFALPRTLPRLPLACPVAGTPVSPNRCTEREHAGLKYTGETLAAMGCEGALEDVLSFVNATIDCRKGVPEGIIRMVVTLQYFRRVGKAPPYIRVGHLMHTGRSCCGQRNIQLSRT